MIVSSRSKFVPNITGVILIDCWDYSETPIIHSDKKILIRNFYQNLVNNIKRFPVKYVVNAMTQTKINRVDDYIDQNLLKNVAHCTIQHWEDFVCCETQQWYVAGQTWNMCVHNNDIGLKNMSNLPNTNFYADQWSFLKDPCYPVLHNDFIQDDLEWQYLKWFGYKLL